MEKHDIVVIGAGPGGYPAAIRAAQLGASVGLVEREVLGGTCLNWGCIPTKTLIAGAHLLSEIRSAGSLGISCGAAAADYTAMLKHKTAVVEKLRAGVAQLLKANGVKVYEGTGSFLSRNIVRVAGRDGQETRLDAAKTIIATGSASAMPGFLPKSGRIVDSRAFLDLNALPATLIVLGGGVVGCELACLAAGLGVKVTVIELLGDLMLGLLDEDARRALRESMEKELGIRVLTGGPLEDIAASDQGVCGRFGKERIEAELMLAAVGRRPVTDGLGLDTVGIKPDKTGFVSVNDRCQTGVPSVYAIGDVTGYSLLAHAATAQGMIAAENACGRRASLRDRVIPSCVYTAPEIGVVGLTEQEAAKQGRSVKTGKFMFGALGRALASAEGHGFVKWVADIGTGQLLGAAAVGPRATELIAEAALAIQLEATAAELARVVHAHPTFSEAWMEAAHAVEGECIHAAPRRKPKR